ncbi:MAG: short-chain dehydrogenase/reductase [Subtercola sp.]|nr:short-chain dehydrogenase/reductase [Subtercola sp.]
MNPSDALSAWADLAGRRAIVIGAAGGIGRGVALALAQVGVELAVCDLDADALLITCTELERASGAPVVRAGVDVRDLGAIETFFDLLAERDFTPDILVNVVGGSFHSDFLATRPKGWQVLVDLNLTYVLASSQRAARAMIEAGRQGSIINITTIEAHRAAPGYAVYAGLKSAVEGFGRSLAVELGPHGIRVNSIAPDYVVTPGVQALQRDLGRDIISAEEAAAIVPLGRLGTVDDVAGCAIFLASGLSRFVTGSTLHPDGGALVAGRWSLSGDEWAPRLP